MADVKTHKVGWDLSTEPSVTVKPLAIKRQDGSLVFVPKGTPVGMPRVSNVHLGERSDG